MSEILKTKRDRLEILRASLELERSSFLTIWKDLADYFLPMRARFQITDANRGQRKNQRIVDSTGTLAARTLRAGMMGGMTSPARPWKRLTTPDPALAEVGSVKEWLHEVDKRMDAIFLKSNLYNSLPIVYGDIGVFGTAAMFMEEDFDDVIRTSVIPIGSYMIANNDKGHVDVFFREFSLTVRQLVQKFGNKTEEGKIDWTNFSTTVKDYYIRAQYDVWIDICHVIQPNDEYDPAGFSSNSKKFRSIYYEKGTREGSPQQSTLGIEDKYLRDSGYDLFPVLAPRWEVTGEDVYATSYPGIIALGGNKSLQTMKKRKAQAVEKGVNPPMVGPSTLKTQKASILPGDITYIDERADQKGFRAAHEVRLSIGELREDIREDQGQVQRAFFEDLFLMLANLEGVQPRNEVELAERRSEKLLQLGPVLEQLNQDLLDKIIDNTFVYMTRQGLVPEPPEELQGTSLKVEYISIMHQAQKSAGLAGIERLAGFTVQVAEYDPTVLDKIDADQMIDEYADVVGVSPKLVRSDEDVEALREAKAAAIQEQQQLEQLQAGAGAAKDLSQADTSGRNALTDLIEASQAGA